MDRIPSLSGSVELGNIQSRSRVPLSPTPSTAVSTPAFDYQLNQDEPAPSANMLRRVMTTARTWAQPVNFSTYILGPALSSVAIIERSSPSGLPLMVSGLTLWVGGITYDTCRGLRTAPDSSRLLDERIYKLLFEKMPVSLGTMLVTGMVAMLVIGQ